MADIDLVAEYPSLAANRRATWNGPRVGALKGRGIPSLTKSSRPGTPT
jgi:hypothetical protein